ncbi:diguanylate cyclase [Candidatus Liberibacter americanus str. Sao Paulo]|uniref:diguanylate cyclase n=2 Tax=Candidatus Liberibacter americanus TaxID=309868 RepID=U6B5G9_9HYPH|nr:diguanylate cyclase [Candidatus Liberibacter americanus str. Sao Paulo]
MIYFSITFAIFIIITIFFSNIILFYIGLSSFYGLKYLLIENISLVFIAVIMSLFLGYLFGSVMKDFFNSYNMVSKLSRTDCLSGLLNHSAFISSIASYNGKLAIVFFDIDYFKNINDNFGHLIGDRVIAFFSYQLLKDFRNPMLVGRLGGEEFAVAAFEYSEKEAAILADKFRNIVEKSFINISSEYSINITISAGVAERFDQEPISKTLHKSDKALYAAKKSGRNRIICFSEI